MHEELIAAAVEWWTNHLAKPAYGDRANGQLEGFESVLMTHTKLMIRNADTPPDAKIDAFRKALTSLLLDYLKKGRDCNLETDYGVEYPLSDACDAAGITGIEFPMKTSMRVSFSENLVSVYTVGNERSTKIYPAD